MGGQVAQLRAQLLRSEQEMHLMRSKLEEERTEREKAQKQVGGGGGQRVGSGDGCPLSGSGLIPPTLFVPLEPD